MILLCRALPAICLVAYLSAEQAALVGYTVRALFYTAFLLIAVLETRGPTYWLTRLKILQWCGVWAYCLYLTHNIIPALATAAINRVGMETSMVTSGLSIALVFLVAPVSWQLFERPLLRIGHKWKY